MNVLYFHQHFTTPEGFAGTRSYAMARRLIERGHTVKLVCGSYQAGKTGLSGPFINGMRKGNVDGIQVIELELPYANALGFLKRTWVFFRYAFRGVGLVLSGDQDVVVASSTPLTAGIPGIVARWLTRKTFVFEVRDLWPELPKAMGVIRNPAILCLMSILEWLSYHSAHHVIALSPGMVAGIQRRKIARDKISMIPNGCDLDIFDENQQPWRPDKIEATDLLAVYSGTFGMANGLDAVVDAAIELQARGRRDIKILLIGDGKLKSAIQTRIAENRLENIILHDPVPKKKLAGLLRSADLGLQILANIEPFYYGTSPNKFFDYIASGLPVLCNYPGWLDDLIVEHNIGFAVPPINAIAFANALEIAADGRKNLKLMGVNARKLAQETFDREMLANEWVDILEAKFCARGVGQ